MNKISKIIIIGVVSIAVSYLIYFLIVFSYSHSVDWDMDKQYLWIFKDSVKKDIDPNFSYSAVEDKDICSHFHYKDFRVTVWEFEELSMAQLDNINIYSEVNLDNVKFRAGETMDSKSDVPITIKFAFALKDAVNVNVDTYSEIYKEVKGSNYKGFLGDLNKFSLSNKDGEHQIIVDFAEGKTSTLLLFYKGARGVFLIMIIPKYDSKKKIDENAINILNLE